MNPVVKVESDDNFQEFGYLKDEGGNHLFEFGPLDDPCLDELIHLDHIVSRFSLEDLEKITRDLDIDSSIPTQGNAEGSSIDTIYKAPTHELQNQVDANNAKPICSTSTTTHELEYIFHDQNNVVADADANAKPIYSTSTTTHELEYIFHEENVVDVKPIYSTTMSACRDGIPKEMYLKNSDNSKFSSSFSNDINVLVGEMPMHEIKSETHESDECLIHLSGDDFGTDQKYVEQKNEEGLVKRQVGRSKTCALQVEEIRKYFDLPITQAAKELNIGLTVLKKRCREFNIMRWPHRKIKSLSCLIQNGKEMGTMNEKEIEMLEEHKKMLEIVPELELTERTKKLRQSCFKANYKKRRLHLATA